MYKYIVNSAMRKKKKIKGMHNEIHLTDYISEGNVGDFYCFHGQTMRFDLLALFGVWLGFRLEQTGFLCFVHSCNFLRPGGVSFYSSQDSCRLSQCVHLLCSLYCKYQLQDPGLSTMATMFGFFMENHLKEIIIIVSKSH